MSKPPFAECWSQYSTGCDYSGRFPASFTGTVMVSYGENREKDGPEGLVFKISAPIMRVEGQDDMASVEASLFYRNAQLAILAPELLRALEMAFDHMQASVECCRRAPHDIAVIRELLARARAI